MDETLLVIRKRTLAFGLLAALYIPLACTHTPVPSCSYTYYVEPIISTKCARPGCHVHGTKLPNFTDYEILKSRADNGRIRKYIFELKIMPPASASPLTEEEKLTINCWLNNGAPKD